MDFVSEFDEELERAGQDLTVGVTGEARPVAAWAACSTFRFDGGPRGLAARLRGSVRRPDATCSAGGGDVPPPRRVHFWRRSGVGEGRSSRSGAAGRSAMAAALDSTASSRRDAPRWPECQTPCKP